MRGGAQIVGPVRCRAADQGRGEATGLLRPRAARAVEAVPLVQPGQRRHGAHRPHLGDSALQRHHDGGDAGGVAFGARSGYGTLVEVGVDVLVGVAATAHVIKGMPRYWA